MLKRRSSSMTVTTSAGATSLLAASATAASPSSNSINNNNVRKHQHHHHAKASSSSPSSTSSSPSFNSHRRSPLPRQYQYQQQQHQPEQDALLQRPEITSTARFRVVGSSNNSNSTCSSTSPSSTLSRRGNTALALSSGSSYDAYYHSSKQQQQQEQQQNLLPLLQQQQEDELKHDDTWNYALLIVLYTLQGIPMGLSASIPFLIQQKIKALASASILSSSSSSSLSSLSGGAAATASSAAAAAATSEAAAATARTLYLNANAIFALCSWPFALKLLWAPIVDACFFPKFGRRKSWLVPCQSVAGMLMVLGSNFVEQQLGFSSSSSTSQQQFHVQGLTLFFLVLYFLMATQDIAVDGWALTLLSPQNRSRGPVCNSIGQNIGFFGSFVGFLALNDVESSEKFWRPLLGLPSNPKHGLVSLGGFLRFMGYVMILTTMAVAVFKTEDRAPTSSLATSTTTNNFNAHHDKQFHPQQLQEDDAELDASVIGLRETYHRLWAVCQLPAVRWLFGILCTYRLPTSLSDNVKFLKAVEYGLSTSTTALLSPTIILPLGILVPIVAAKVWHGHPLKQFMTAYKVRVTLVPLLDVLMLWMLKRSSENNSNKLGWWMITMGIIVLSTAAQAIVQSLQFNAQMMFFAKKVDPAIGGSYMTLLNTAANLGGTWPSSFVLSLLSRLSSHCNANAAGVNQGGVGGGGMSAGDAASSSTASSSCRDPYFMVQAIFSILGLIWIWLLGGRVQQIAQLPDDAWRTHLLDDAMKKDDNNQNRDIENNDKNNIHESPVATTTPPRDSQHPYQYNYNAYASTATPNSPSSPILSPDYYYSGSSSPFRRNLASVEVELGGITNSYDNNNNSTNNNAASSPWHRQPRQHQQQFL